VVAQVALSCGLLTVAGLTAKEPFHLIHVDEGFRADGVLTAQLSLPDGDYPEREPIPSP